MAFCGLRRRERVDKHASSKDEKSDWLAVCPSAQSVNQFRHLPQLSVSLPDINSTSRPPAHRQVSTFSQASTLSFTPPPVYPSKSQFSENQRISSNGPPILPAISQQSSFSSFRELSESLPPSLSVFMPPSAQTQTGFQIPQQQPYLAQPHTLSPILDSPGPSAALSNRLAARPHFFERIECAPTSRAPTPPRRSSKRGARPVSLPIQARQPRTSTLAPTHSRPTSLSPNSIPRKPLPISAQAPSLPSISGLSRFESVRLGDCGVKRSNTGYSSHYGDSPKGSGASDHEDNKSDDEDGSWNPPGGLSPNAYEEFAKMTPFERQQSLRYRNDVTRSVLPPLRSEENVPPVPEIPTIVGESKLVSQQSRAQTRASKAQRPVVPAAMRSGASVTTQRSEDGGIGLGRPALPVISSSASVTTQREDLGRGLQLRPEGMINRRSFASIRTQEGKGVGLQDMMVQMRKRESERELKRGLVIPVLSREISRESRLEVENRPVPVSSFRQLSGESREVIGQEVRQPGMWDGNQVPEPLNLIKVRSSRGLVIDVPIIREPVPKVLR